MHSSRVHDLATAARDCAAVMEYNASFMLRELPNVTMSDGHLAATTKLCSRLKTTSFDVASDIRDLLDSNVDAGGSGTDRIVRYIHDVISRDLLALHQLVAALEEASRWDPKRGSAYMLVSGSAVNILDSFRPIREYVANVPARNASDGEPVVAPGEEVLAIRALALNYFRRLVLWFSVLLATSVFCASMFTWASRQRGWQGTAVETVFALIGGIASLGVLFFGASIVVWWKARARAVKDIDLWNSDKQAFRHIHREAVGPIPWRS